MTPIQQLQSNCQTMCAKRLPEWEEYRKRGLYRRTKDFVQWLIFDASRFNVAVVPQYAIQALAEQFPAEALALGDRVRDSRGADLWISSADWHAHRAALVERIVAQIEPLTSEPLTPQAIVEYLDHSRIPHVSAWVALGIAKVLLREAEAGRHALREAVEQYRRMDVSWARDTATRIEGWLSQPTPETLLQVVRQDAERGAELLKLQ